MREWKWIVIYKDGSHLTELDGHGFGDVAFDKVERLTVFDFNDETALYTIPICDGMRPIFFRRKRTIIIENFDEVPVEYVDEHGNLKDTTYTFATVLGWQKTVNGRNVKSLLWLMADGSVAVTDCDLDEL